MADKDYLISKEMLLNIFEYKDGSLYRNGKQITSKDNKGYIRTKINGVQYSAHRIIFMMHHGRLPKFIDHIDGNRLNNRIENLREATLQQNNWNRKISVRNKSGIKGISFSTQANKWKAQCTVAYKQYHLGYFSDINEAKKAVEDFRSTNHGEFSRQI